MNTLTEALEEYLVTRRALGFKLRHTGRTLPKFVDFIIRENASFITTELALRWAQANPSASCTTQSDRLTMVRQFASWRCAADPRTEIPPSGLLLRRYQRPAPYIYTEDEIARIISCAASLCSPKDLRGLTCATLFGLLKATGMRVGETVALDRDDVDFQTGVISIRHGKLGKSRFIPIHITTLKALQDYSKKRDAILPSVATPAFFVSESGRRMTQWAAQYNFSRVLRTIGLRPKDGRRFGHGPRIHDFRHRFSVSTLIHWYRTGVDVEREMPKLVTYLGHASTEAVYWYLQAVPELLQLATERSRHMQSGGAA